MKKLIFSLLFVATAVVAMAESRTDKLLRELRDPKSDYVFVAAHRADWQTSPKIH